MKDFSTGSDLRRSEYTNAGDCAAITAGIRQTYFYDLASYRLTTAESKARR